MAKSVEASYIDISVTQTSAAGALTVVDFPDDVRTNLLPAVASATHATGGGWIDVRPYTLLSCTYHADTAANGNACSFTIEMIGSAGAATAQAADFLAATSIASNTVDSTTTKGADIKHVAFIRVLENGTTADLNYVSVLCK